MSRRPQLPGADELFRATAGAAAASTETAGSRGPALARRANPALVAGVRGVSARASDQLDTAGAVAWEGTSDAVASLEAEEFGQDQAVRQVATPAVARPIRIARRGDAQPTGRERHDEKITVYCSPDELVHIEHARLTLRATHGLAVDRGRIVREAIAVVLADLDAKGESSILVRRLRGR